MWIQSQLAYLICPAREICECQLLDVHPGPQQWGCISPKFSFPQYTYQKNLIIKSIPGGGENKTSDTQDSSGNIALRANFISNHVRVSFGILTWMLFPAFPERFWFLLYNSLICFSSVLTFFFFFACCQMKSESTLSNYISDLRKILQSIHIIWCFE